MATTMTQVMTEYERSLEEWAREKYAKELGEERAAEHAAVLCRLAGRRFGADAGERLAELFGSPPDSQRLARAEAAVLDCGGAASAGAELLGRLIPSAGLS